MGASPLRASGVKLTLDNTIVGGNTASSTANGPDIVRVTGTVTLNSSLIGNTTGLTITGSTTSDILNPTYLGLSTLGYYGGPTQTIALLPLSPAIGKGSTTLVPAAGSTILALNPSTDQRGETRIVSGTVDMGAFETQTSLVVTTAADPGQILGQLSLREAINLADSGAANTSTITFASSLSGSTITLASAAGALSISKNLTIVGLGASSLAINGTNVANIFINSATASISGLTIEDNAASGVVVLVATAIDNTGTLTLNNVTLTGNTSDGGTTGSDGLNDGGGSYQQLWHGDH